jgi:hypothetical protein
LGEGLAAQTDLVASVRARGVVTRAWIDARACGAERALHADHFAAKLIWHAVAASDRAARPRALFLFFLIFF